MGILNIRPARREGARLVIGLAGISGGGKTFTGLQLAWGLAGGDASKVGLLDTENRRGSLYADSLKDKDGKVHPFLIGDLHAPFSPQRYREAILEFQAAGVKVLVIDTASHEWAGLGGVLDIVDSHQKSIHGWKAAKPEHKRFMNTLLQCDMHVIVCIRAAQKTDWKDAKNPKSLGVMPVQNDEFMFEMTASMMMWSGGKVRDVLKCPAELSAIFGEAGTSCEGYLGAKQGLALLRWVEGGGQIDPLESHRNALRTVCERGMAELEKAWLKVPKSARDSLGEPFLEELKAAAGAFDEQRATAAAGGQDETAAALQADLEATP